MEEIYDCSEYCFNCRKFKIYNVNDSEFHGLCGECAQGIAKESYNCNHCETPIQIRFLKPCDKINPCVNCSNSTNEKCSINKHLFCRDCKNKQLQCSSCACATCLKNNGGQACGNHLQCYECKQEYKGICYGCYCQVCNRGVADTKYQDCKHPVCSMCVRNAPCRLCIPCSYCGQKSFCKRMKCYNRHYSCYDCEIKLVNKLQECPACKNNLFYYKCHNCSKPRFDLSKCCDTDLHAYCRDCINNGLSYCKTCKKCQRCQKIVECIQGTCGHLLCTDCNENNGHCNKCESERGRVYCKNCGDNVANFFQLQCGNHFVCEKCSIANYYCQDCLVTCDQCKRPSYTIALKANCDHTICNVC